MAKLLGCLLQYHLHFVDFAGFDAIEHCHAIGVPVHIKLSLIFLKILQPLVFNLEPLIQLEVSITGLKLGRMASLLCKTLS